MIEVALINYLLNKTSVGNHVYAERPKEVPPKYIVIEKTGSRTENMITTSTIAIQSIADSMQDGTMIDALKLNDEVKRVMSDIETLPAIIMSKLNSDYNYTDDTTKEYRYQAVYLITHY